MRTTITIVFVFCFFYSRFRISVIRQLLILKTDSKTGNPVMSGNHKPQFAKDRPSYDCCLSVSINRAPFHSQMGTAFEQCVLWLPNY